MEIISTRIAHQHLGHKKFASPEKVVEWFSAVQAQDYHAAKWGLALRLNSATDAGLDERFNAGAFLRTHVMRPTWHFVPPQDVRWMQQATAHRVRMLMAADDRKLGVDRKLIRRTNALLEKELRDKTFLTRDELSARLKKNGITASGQMLAHIMMHAELDALICSGPRRGKQFTYALLDERAPKQQVMEKQEALAALAGSYVRSHGPVQTKDFAWWSGLTLKEAETGLNAASTALVRTVIGGTEYWSTSKRIPSLPASPFVLLLSFFDEFNIAYKDRSALGGEAFGDVLKSMGNDLTALLVIDGRIAGTWKRTIGNGKAELIVSPLRRLTKEERAATEEAAERYGTFVQLPVVIQFR